MCTASIIGFAIIVFMTIIEFFSFTEYIEM